MMPNLTTGTYGFPSDIADDPVLHLAMPSPDTFTHAEERRLFYVALTRGRREVTLITPTQRISAQVQLQAHTATGLRPARSANGRRPRRPCSGSRGHARHTGAGADYDLATSQIDAPHESKGPDR
jgi:DNA helicase-4